MNDPERARTRAALVRRVDWHGAVCYTMRYVSS
jgi:hypothetical protein